MARKLPTACNYPGCPEVSTERYCAKHKRQTNKQYDKQRGTAAQRGYDYRWNRYSKWYRKQHPFCVECMKKGKLSPSQHVDHIEAVSGPDDPKFWDPDNHQGLCHSCHSLKTVREDGGFGR